MNLQALTLLVLSCVSATYSAKAAGCAFQLADPSSVHREWEPLPGAPEALVCVGCDPETITSLHGREEPNWTGTGSGRRELPTVEATLADPNRRTEFASWLRLRLEKEKPECLFSLVVDGERTIGGVKFISMRYERICPLGDPVQYLSSRELFGFGNGCSYRIATSWRAKGTLTKEIDQKVERLYSQIRWSTP